MPQSGCTKGSKRRTARKSAKRCAFGARPCRHYTYTSCVQRGVKALRTPQAALARPPAASLARATCGALRKNVSKLSSPNCSLVLSCPTGPTSDDQVARMAAVNGTHRRPDALAPLL